MLKNDVFFIVVFEKTFVKKFLKKISLFNSTPTNKQIFKDMLHLHFASLFVTILLFILL